MKKIINFLTGEDRFNIYASLLSIVIGLFFGYILILITHPKNSFEVFNVVLQGGFYHGMRGIGQVLFKAYPLILTGLSVGFAFKTGLFNIGVTGQFTLGAFVAIYCGVNWSWMPNGLGWIIASLLGMLAGAVWGFIVGMLKAYRNVNEVISSIMMNYIAMYLVIFLIKHTAYDKIQSRTLSPKYAFLPRLGLDKIFGGAPLNVGIIIAILVAILMWIILDKTVFGYELKAVGFNRDASRYTGINEKAAIMKSMTIAGALAGLAGALMYLSDAGLYISLVNTLLPQGFDGIAVALLGMSNPIGTIFSGFFISHISYGGGNLQLFGLQPEIVEVIISVIIYVSALSVFLKAVVSKVLTKRGGTKA